MHNSTKMFPHTINPEIWVDAYGRSLFKYALFRLRNAELAEEKIQETFLAALQSRHRFQGQSTEKVWLISILKRKIFDYFREKNRHGHFGGTVSLEGLSCDAPDCQKMKAVRLNSGSLDPLTVCEQKEFLKNVRRALSKLPKRQATVFILRDVMELSRDEICELMNISVCNLYIMIHWARQRLRHILKFEWA